MGVSFRNIRKEFPNGTVALDRFDLSFPSGEFIVLLGPSGSGKSTACRLLAGLEQPSSGTIEVGDVDVTHLPPRARNMSMVFQNYALYPHKSVYENIAYPLRVRKTARAEVDRAVREMASMLRIDKLLERRPRQLSGGEAQRVAVARALVWQPEICLMDEPLSNLDALLRLHTRAELKRIHQHLQKTFVFVTHDQEEAMSLGTRIAVLEAGRLVQFDTPREIYHRPATRFVAEFIGRPAMNTIEGTIEDGVFRAGAFSLAIGDDCPSGPVVLGIRPEKVELRDAPDRDTVTLSMDVMEVVEPDTLLTLHRDPAAPPRELPVRLIVRVMRELAPMERGADVHVHLPRQALHFFDIEDGRRLQ